MKISCFIADLKQMNMEKRQLWDPKDLRFEVMRMLHDPPATGHMGVTRMYGTMHDVVFWKGMKRDVITYVSSCDVCQRHKLSAQRVPQSAKPVPAKCLEEVSLDIVGPVPPSSTGKKYVLCIQDRFSRYLVFYPLKDQTAEAVAHAFMYSWVYQFGAPQKIITDRGSNFMSSLFSSLCEFLGAKHSLTCAYRPQGNAENECAHREVHLYLSMYLTNTTKTTWDLLLAQASWTHNTTYHTALKKSPFEVLTGLQPRNASGLLADLTEKREHTMAEYVGNWHKHVLRRLQINMHGHPSSR